MDNEELVKISSAGTISIPKSFRRQLQIQKGDHVKIVLENDRILVKKVTIS